MSFLQGLQLSVAKVNEQGAFDEDGSDKGGFNLGSGSHSPGVSGDQISEQFGSDHTNSGKSSNERAELNDDQHEREDGAPVIPTQHHQQNMEQQQSAVSDHSSDLHVDAEGLAGTKMDDEIPCKSEQTQLDCSNHEGFQRGEDDSIDQDSAVYLPSLRVVSTIPYAEKNSIVVFRANHFDEFVISLNKLLSPSGLHLTRDAGSLTLFETCQDEPEVIEASELVQASKLLELAETETRNPEELVERETKKKKKSHKKKANREGRTKEGKGQSKPAEVQPTKESPSRDYPALDKVEQDSGPRAISPRPGHLNTDRQMVAVNHRGVKKTVSERDRTAISTWGLHNVWACLWYKGNDPDYYEVSLLEGHPDDDVESLLKWYIADRGLDNCIQDDLEASEVYFLHFN